MVLQHSLLTYDLQLTLPVAAFELFFRGFSLSLCFIGLVFHLFSSLGCRCISIQTLTIFLH